MDPAISVLQSAINRFAAVGGFPKVSVDGLWGSLTLQGAQNALLFVGQGKCYKSACVDDDTARSAAGILQEWDQTMSAAKGIGDFLGGVANDLNLPHVASPLPVPAGGSIVPHLPGFSTSLLDRFTLMPLWQRVLIGVLGGLGLIFVAQRLKRRGAATKRAKR